VSYQQVPLGQLIKPARLERAKTRDLPILSMTMHQGLVDQSSKFKKRIASADTADYRVVTREQLVVGFPIDEGVLSFQDLYDEAVVSPAYHVWDVRPARPIEPRYLERFLRSPRALSFYSSKLRGTTARRRSLPDDVFLRLEVPLPSAAEQRRIAEVLDRAEALRAKRRAALAQLDTLTQSIFLDMFGDATNPKGWPCRTIRELGRVTTGGTPPSARLAMFGGPIPFVTPGDLESDVPAKRTLTEAGAAESVTVRPGAALVCCIGATIGKVGRAAVTSAFNQQINAVEWGDYVEDRYGETVLRFLKPTIIARATSTTLPILKKSAFERIEIPVPPVDLQRVFERRLSAVDRLRSRSRASLSSFDALFASLQRRAFAGEL
jgi:type I restriction enzyme, S subunit